MDRAQVVKRAYRALADCGLDHPPFDPRRVAENYGAVVIGQEADDSESGFCLRSGGRTLIGVNSNHRPHRQRFTISHEVGHLLLHEGRSLTVDKSVRVSYRNDISSMATDSEEIEANAFAAALLMPQDHVRAAASPLVKSQRSEREIISRLAKKFDVSSQAMTFRLVNLGILLG
ncbi:ImmA/IrrE family metallo-endopeptidase [Pseudonocardia nematodicida]|uniref:ImmA/IrrE family metallo-endopeptidase n=1 Tax=Pseudonocardia nematodicida TaxID=1206997 RepID=A0ABV1KEK9_9PSEU